MMLFNITFTLDSEKRKIIERAIKKKRIKITPKKLLLIFVILIITAIFVCIQGLQIGASFFSIFSLPYILINLFALYEKRKAENKLLKRSTTFSLYEDRIEIIYNPTEDYKGTFERVYPLSAVREFLDYNNFFVISFDNGDSHFLIKSDFTQEQLEILNSKIKK